MPRSRMSGFKRPSERDVESSGGNDTVAPFTAMSAHQPSSPTVANDIQVAVTKAKSVEDWSRIIVSLEAAPVDDTHKDKYLKGLVFVKSLHDLLVAHPTKFELFNEELSETIKEELIPLIDCSPPASVPISFAVEVTNYFGAEPTKPSVLNKLDSLTLYEEWKDAVAALNKLVRLSGKEAAFEEALEGFEMLDFVAFPLQPNMKKILMNEADKLLSCALIHNFNNTIAGHFKRRNNGSKETLLTALFSNGVGNCTMRLLVGSKDAAEAGRAVKVAEAVTETSTIKAISSMIAKKLPAIVLTGEAGSGKTVGSMLGATHHHEHFAVFLGTRPYIVQEESDGITTEQEQKDAVDKKLTAWLKEGLAASSGLRFSGALSEALTCTPTATLTVIVDELGDARDTLRSFIRLASSESLVEDIKRVFGVGHVCFLAVGTGCHDAIFPAGSRAGSFNTRFTSADDGHVIWRQLMRAASCSSDAPMAPYLRALAGGLSANGSEDCVLGAVKSHSEGYVVAWTGRALVGNARVAAFIAAHVKRLVTTLRPVTVSKSPSALIEACLPFVTALHHEAIHGFVSRGGLAKVNPVENSDGDSVRMRMVAEALACALIGTDADIPQDMFLSACAQTGVLTSHGIAVTGVPSTGRAIEASEVGGVSQRLVVEDSGRRYRVTEAMAMMYLTAFGATRRYAPTGEMFEVSVLDYVRTVLVPASIVAEWSRSGDAARRAMSVASSKFPPSGLFQLLVDAFLEAKVTVGEVLVSKLSSKFEPLQGHRLSKVWAALGCKKNVKGAQHVPVAVVLNADKASGADLMVLCRGHFAIHIQVKSHQKTQLSAETTLDEPEKMGFGGSTTEDFKKHYFACVRCLSDKAQVNGALSEPLQPNCRYIELRPCDRSFYPLVIVPSATTAPALSGVSSFFAPTSTAAR